jgi:hypothetical protein
MSPVLYQIVYAGNFDLTMDGAEATPEKIQKTYKAHKDYMRVPKLYLATAFKRRLLAVQSLMP